MQKVTAECPFAKTFPSKACTQELASLKQLACYQLSLSKFLNAKLPYADPAERLIFLTPAPPLCRSSRAVGEQHAKLPYAGLAEQRLDKLARS